MILMKKINGDWHRMAFFLPEQKNKVALLAQQMWRSTDWKIIDLGESI